MKLFDRIKTFIRNIKYLSRIDLNDSEDTILSVTKRAVAYGDLLNPSKANKIRVLDAENSLKIILNSPKSFYRYGDGEINIMSGENAGTQEYNPRLAKLLSDALCDESNSAYIGIGYEYFNFDVWGINDFANRFYLSSEGEEYRKFYLKNCSTKVTYIDTGFTQRYFSLREEEQDKWYSQIESLFIGKKIKVFMGKSAYDNLDYKIYDKADKVEYWFGPSKNAFDMYDEILDIARKTSKDTILCFALGATAKALIYELSKEKYLCYDIGHMAKDYDSYKKHIPINYKNAERFYTDDYKLR